jgi:Cys-tRNA(Pro)/Cys-tRNA(Cys) deacylase
MFEAYEAAVALLTFHSVPFTVHEHIASRTVADAKKRLPFPSERFLKTIAFIVKDGPFVLAALRGMDGIDYRRLATASGAKRADIVRLSPEEVTEAFGVEVGSVGPLVLSREGEVLFDVLVPMAETVFCGIGRADRTLEILLADLVRITRGRVVPLASEQG